MGLEVLLVLLVLGVVEDIVVLLLAVMTVGRTGRLLVEALVRAVVLVEELAAGVRVITPVVVVVGNGAGTGAGPGRSSAGVAGVGVWKGAGSAACRFHHKGLFFSLY